MLFTDDEEYEIEKYLQRWIKNWYVGGICRISEYKKYDVKVWLQIVRAIRYAEMSLLSDINNAFLLRCKYDGHIYRVMEYLGHDECVLFPMKHYQSWAKDINSLLALFHKIKNPVIIEAYAHDQDYAIDVDNLTNRMCKLSSNKKTNEITVPVHKENILRIYTVNFNLDKNVIEEIEDIPREFWFKDCWYDI